MQQLIAKIRIPLLIFVLGICAIAATQHAQVFPQYYTSLLYKQKQTEPTKLPAGVTSSRIRTSDNIELEVWRMQSKSANLTRGKTLIFHGNGQTVDQCLYLLEWMAELGFDAYVLDYRGYGRSQGIPTESGLYRDADAFWDAVITPEDQEINLVGFSLGGGPAAYLAAKHTTDRVRRLILLAPFSSIPDVAKDRGYPSFLQPLILLEFPVRKYVAELKATDLIIAHSPQDPIIPFEQSGEILQAYRGTGRSVLIKTSQATHNDILGATKSQIDPYFK
ncbi:alpha/beta fold hydrolase [bacterium]|nr:alpha/beta fold hydrolase [bacterium]